MSPWEGIACDGARVVAVAMFAVTLAVAPAGHAQTVADPATELGEAKRQADEALAADRYARALELYRQVHAHTRDPALHYNMGRALQYLGRPVEALAEFDAFMHDAPEELRSKVPALPALMQELTKQVATLRVSANTDGALVHVRGELVGATPLVSGVRVSAGKATVELEKEGYFPIRRELDLPGGAASELAFVLVPRASGAFLRVRALPVGARIEVDGQPWGNAPTENALSSGAHRIRAIRDGYQPREVSVELTAGAQRDVDLSLEAERSLLGRWWFWTAAGAVVLGGAVTVYAITTERSVSTGSLAPGKITSVLSF